MKSKSKRLRILEVLRAAGDDGLTCEQVELAAGVSHPTATGRLHDLRKAGLVLSTSLKRATSKGNEATVYVAMAPANPGDAEIEGND